MTAPYSTVLIAPDPPLSGETLTVREDHGYRFPEIPFTALVWPVQQNPTATNSERLEVKTVDEDVFSFERGTSPIAITAGMMIAVVEAIPVLKLGETIRLEISYVSADPPYTCQLRSPLGALSEVTGAAGTDDEGNQVYFNAFEPTSSGRWHYRWQVGDPAAVTADSSFFVEYTSAQ